MARKKPDLVLRNVKIEAVAAEGKAVAHVDGVVVFVPFAVPGDVADIRVTKKKKNYMEGYVTALVQPSPDRLPPACRHFGVCGGCRWQPLPYSMQLEAKQRQVYDQLVRIGRLEAPEISPILPAEQTLRYRNKLEYSFSSKRWLLEGETPESVPEEERMGLGFHVGRFFDKVVDIEECLLQAEPSNAIRLFIKRYALAHGLEFFHIRENTGFLRNLFIRNNAKGEFMVTLCFHHEDRPAREALLEALSAAFPSIVSLYYLFNDKPNDSIADRECLLYRGKPFLVEEMEGLHFRIGPKSFYQTHSAQALRLYRVVRDFAALGGWETVYDLYTGIGTIAQFVAGGAKKVIGIEYVPEAVADAAENAAANGIGNCEFFAGDMRKVLDAAFIAAHGRPDVVILDPPRAGLHPAVVKVLLETAPERLVYVSCNPASQARDLALLCGDYALTAVQPVDMFPHTQHVENVCRLTRKRG